MILNLGPSKNIVFFKANSGSHLEKPINIKFGYIKNTDITKVSNIKEEMVGSCINVMGHKEAKNVLFGAIEKAVWEAILANDTGHIPISIFTKVVV